MKQVMKIPWVGPWADFGLGLLILTAVLFATVSCNLALMSAKGYQWEGWATSKAGTWGCEVWCCKGERNSRFQSPYYVQNPIVDPYGSGQLETQQDYGKGRFSHRRQLLLLHSDHFGWRQNIWSEVSNRTGVLMKSDTEGFLSLCTGTEDRTRKENRTRKTQCAAPGQSPHQESALLSPQSRTSSL